MQKPYYKKLLATLTIASLTLAACSKAPEITEGVDKNVPEVKKQMVDKALIWQLIEAQAFKLN